MCRANVFFSKEGANILLFTKLFCCISFWGARDILMSFQLANVQLFHTIITMQTPITNRHPLIRNKLSAHNSIPPSIGHRIQFGIRYINLSFLQDLPCLICLVDLLNYQYKFLDRMHRFFTSSRLPRARKMFTMCNQIQRRCIPSKLYSRTS